MYGLLQSGSLGHDLLEQHLNQESYFQSKIVPGFWKHEDRKIQFVLVVDDFGIKFIQQGNLDHLIYTLKSYYNIMVSQASGHHYLSENVRFPLNNGTILNVAEIIKAVMSFSAKSELSALYINAQKAIKA